jgi:biotin carboxyl carrier protein
MSAKLFATINSAAEPLVLERRSPNAPWTLPGEDAADLVRTGPGMYSLVHKGRSFRVLVLKHDAEAGTVRLRIGAHGYTLKLEGERSRLFQLLGIDKAARTMARELKAPMPGLVLKLLVKEGDVVQKDDPLLVLEAMKMENVIKSTGGALVKKIHVQERSAVEKGQLLLSFE